MKTIFINIKSLVQVRALPIPYIAGAEMKILPTIENAYLIIEGENIIGYGPMEDLQTTSKDKTIDVSGRIVLPTWCDPHTHIVYAGNREGEFVDKINGVSYEEIANNGGGILNSAKKLSKTSKDELFEQSDIRLKEIIQLGTGAVEIKSGYGLSFDAELKMLKVIQALKEKNDIPIKATFLGAHAVPESYKEDKKGYLQMLIGKLLPIIENENLADYIDIFCETGYFTVEDAELIMKAGKKHGLIPKIHVNQFTSIGGVQAGVVHGALSVDHLEVMTDEDIKALLNKETMPIALPGCSYFLGIPFTPVRKMMDAGLPIALATDFNPGSTPSGNMNFVVATACIKMKMTPEEAINAATINSAYAMGLSDQLGSITKGKLANLIITKPINSYATIPYAFGDSKIDMVYLKGKLVVENGNYKY